MKVLHDNVLVTEANKEEERPSGIILSKDISSGHKAAVVIAAGEIVEGIKPTDKVYLDWSKAMPVELDGLKCAVVSFRDIKLVISE